MKSMFGALALAAVTILPATAAPNVGVSIGIDQPGIYGRIDIGSRPPPAVVYAQPVVIAPSRVAMHQRPIYLYVPPGHQANWGRHCGRYGACGQPVYFVREQWVQEQRGRHDRHGKGRHEMHGKKKGHDHNGRDRGRRDN
jgi:hypothetical protein